MSRDVPLCPAPHRDDRPRLAADGLRLCLWHRDRLERHVAELPALYDACGAALAGRGGANGAGKSEEWKVAQIINAAADLANAILGVDDE